LDAGRWSILDAGLKAMEPVLLAGVVYSLWDMTFPSYTADVGWYAASVGVVSCLAGWLSET
jgi:hypothetical protein